MLSSTHRTRQQRTCHHVLTSWSLLAARQRAHRRAAMRFAGRRSACHLHAALLAWRAVVLQHAAELVRG